MAISRDSRTPKPIGSKPLSVPENGYKRPEVVQMPLRYSKIKSAENVIGPFCCCSVLFKLIVFCILLFVVPLASFYFCKKIVFPSSAFDFRPSSCLYLENGEIASAVVSVLTANAVIMAFILLAFKEDDRLKHNIGKKAD